MFKSTLAFIIAVLFFIVGLMLLIKRIKQEKNNTAETEATIIDFDREESYDSDTGTSIVYYPILKYKVNNKEYILRDNHGGNRKDLGKIVTINYNPSKPEEFHIKNQLASWIIPILVMIAGAIFACLMVNWENLLK